MDHQDVRNALHSVADDKIARHSRKFFKTGEGEYGEGDKFLGIRVPEQRKVASKYKDLSLSETLKLLHSDFHEERLTALFILIHQYEKGDDSDRKTICRLYLDNTAYINNWDLVDSSAYKILGHFLETHDRKILYKLAQSDLIWERRIAMMACLHFIKNEDFEDALKIAEILLNDTHDLIQKAVGWMLREIGNRDRDQEESFLREYAHKMPRTTLRYAIEKFPEPLRQEYLSM